MSRRIDPHRVLTEDEVTYLLDRGMTNVLDENALWMMGGGSDEAAVTEAIAAEEAGVTVENDAPAVVAEAEDETPVSDADTATDTEKQPEDEPKTRKRRGRSDDK